MQHPYAAWTRKILESYIGTTEALTLEFKSYRALIWSNQTKNKADVIREAAKDVAAMANEQGGIIIYGIEESRTGARRKALHIEDGFETSDGVSREWFMQMIRSHINPPIEGMDAVDVELGNERIALVVLVPQAIGTAHQTDDLYFYRRDAQGIHKMTVQEIEDVRQRRARPLLTLDFVPVSAFRIARTRRQSGQEQGEFEGRFEILNTSSVTASFAVITIGLHNGAHLSNPDMITWASIPNNQG